jgi:hypothetical protein
VNERVAGRRRAPLGARQDRRADSIAGRDRQEMGEDRRLFVVGQICNDEAIAGGDLRSKTPEEASALDLIREHNRSIPAVRLREVLRTLRRAQAQFGASHVKRDRVSNWVSRLGDPPNHLK